nr:senescence-specific cysteine protease sag39 [Quercus suber]
MSRTLLEDSIVERYQQWMAKYGRNYEDDAEKEKRFKIFKDNVEYIDKVNNEGNRTYKLSVNEFADLTTEEFIATRTGFKISSQPSSPKTSFRYENLTEIPMTMDWREKGAVTPIKNQGQCGKRIITLMLLGLFSCGSGRGGHPDKKWQQNLPFGATTSGLCGRQ